MIHGVIMAGGIGMRFWPKSRKDTPKQILKIVDDTPLLTATVRRIRPMIPLENTWVVTNADQKAILKTHLPELDDGQFIVEPTGKNTAPCIGLAAIRLRKIDPEAVMIVLPADHRITEDEKFLECLKVASDQAVQSQCLVTIGIQPTRPETGYGYIQYNQALDSGDKQVYHVKTFAEKPSLATAKLFLRSGDFLWNSGIFVWTADRIIAEIEEHLPELYMGLRELDKAIGTKQWTETLEQVYRSIKSISIDYGVMEHASRVCVVRGDFLWSDVGSWEEVYRISQKDSAGNATRGETLIIDSEGCLIDSPDRLTAVLGVKDLVVISAPDATLVCSREAAQDVKKVVEALLKKKADKYL